MHLLVHRRNSNYKTEYSPPPFPLSFLPPKQIYSFAFVGLVTTLSATALGLIGDFM